MYFWSKLGISVALVAAFSITISVTLQDGPFYQRYHWFLCGVFAVAGLSLLLAGHQLTDADATGSVRYCGTMLFVFACVIAVTLPSRTVPGGAVEPVASASRSQMPVRAQMIHAPEPPPKPQPLSWPPNLKLQGVAHHQTRHCALVNGRTYFIGDRIGETKLVAVHREFVVLQLGDQTRVLQLGRGIQ